MNSGKVARVYPTKVNSVVEITDELQLLSLLLLLKAIARLFLWLLEFRGDNLADRQHLPHPPHKDSLTALLRV